MSSITFKALKFEKIPLKSLLVLRRSNVHLKSAAVSVLPEWNLTPSRNLKRTVFSSVRSHDVAKRGSNDIKIDFSRFPSHVYYVKIITKSGTIIKKVVLDK